MALNSLLCAAVLLINCWLTLKRITFEAETVKWWNGSSSPLFSTSLALYEWHHTANTEWNQWVYKTSQAGTSQCHKQSRHTNDNETNKTIWHIPLTTSKCIKHGQHTYPIVVGRFFFYKSLLCSLASFWKVVYDIFQSSFSLYKFGTVLLAGRYSK